MKIVALFAVSAALLISAGCTNLHSVVTTTQTGVGVSLSENPTTQLYEMRLGYFRNEFAFVPGNTNDPTSIPDVMMEIHIENILKGGHIYQRLAVGRNAVSQPGASLMFARDTDGTISSNAASALSQKIQSIPLPPNLR